MTLYTSSELTAEIEKVVVTPELLAKYNVSEVSLMVQVLPSDYELCRQELMALANGYTTSVETDVESDSYLTSELSQSGKTYTSVDCIPWLLSLT